MYIYIYIYIYAIIKHPFKTFLKSILKALKYRCFLDIQIKKCRLASYLMEHIYFEAQLCSEIATLKKKHQKTKEQQITFGG